MSLLSRLFRRSGPASTRPLHDRRRLRPALELLEDRCTPAAMSSIGANFNGSTIAAGNTIWFDAALTASGLPAGQTVEINVVNQTINFTAGGVPYSIAVPNSVIELTPGQTTASLSFDPGDGDWDVSAPTGGAGTTFMGGVGWNVPVNLPGNIQAVTWNAGFWSDTKNVTIKWQWAAAEYTSFSSDPNDLNVKPVDSNNFGINNKDQSGTPEAFKTFVVAGGTGGGGTNYTGNYTSTKSVVAQWGDGASAYPYASSSPLTSVGFNESTVLKAAQLDTTNGYFKLWYSDEHALALGVSQVTIKTSSGTTTTNYPVSTMGSSNVASVTNPLVGGLYQAPAQPVTTSALNLALNQPQGNTDVSGRPMFPALFITDTTGNASNSSGDWQWGGTPILPNAVFGTWKSFTETIDQTLNTVTVTTTADPAYANAWNLGAGSDAPPAGTPNEAYGAEVRWNLADLQNAGILVPGHTYRFYVMVHDGDQNKSGGDAGQAVFNYSYGGVAVQTVSLSGTFIDTSGTGAAGAVITLFNATTGQVVATATTLADGTYSFTNLSAGQYKLQVTLPPAATAAGYIGLGASAGTVAGVQRGTSNNFDIISGITLVAGDIGVNYNFGDGIPGG